MAGGALAFILWVLALERATPTRVANTMTVNPVAAALLATVLVAEPITLNLIVGRDRGVRRDLDRDHRAGSQRGDWQIAETRTACRLPGRSRCRAAPSRSAFP